MNNQNQLRPFLVPLQTSQLDSDAARGNGNANKRLRGAQHHVKADDDNCVDGRRQSVSPVSYSQTVPPVPDQFRFKPRHGGSPLPQLRWANSEDVWNLMCWKETNYKRDPNLLQRHPQITPKMRAVLFEWISEVCEVYKLHRETFYICMDFVDRYLSEESHMPKSRLQLLGITALFIAAKLEEIYPPQVKDFAFVTDRACTVEQILAMELVMLQVLNWTLSPVTVNHWLMLYLQIIASEVNSNLINNSASRGTFVRCREFLIPQFQRMPYIRLTQLTDLCSLDPGALHFQYSVIAASAFYHLLQPEQLTLLVSGFAWHDLKPCIAWMEPFARVIKEQDVGIKIFDNVPNDDMHNIQTQFVKIHLLERAQAYAMEQVQNRSPPPTPYHSFPTSPLANHHYHSFLTPPPPPPNPYHNFPTPPDSQERPPMQISRLPAFPPNFQGKF